MSRTLARSDCPVCHEALTPHGLDDSSCCLRCGGTWLPASASSAFARVRYTEVTGESVGLFGVKPQCPGCAGALTRRLVLGVGAVDGCGVCGGMWAGPGKLERLQAVAVGLPTRAPVPTPQVHPAPLWWKTAAVLSAVSAAAAWLLSAGGHGLY